MSGELASTSKQSKVAIVSFLLPASPCCDASGRGGISVRLTASALEHGRGASKDGQVVAQAVAAIMFTTMQTARASRKWRSVDAPSRVVFARVLERVAAGGSSLRKTDNHGSEGP